MTTNKIYYSPETPPHVFAKTAAAWVHNTAYLLGILVTNGGNTYFCLEGHTSTNNEETGFSTDLAAGKWILVTASVWTPESVALGAGRISAVWDRGSGDKPFDYTWRASTAWVNAPTINESLRIHLLSSYAAAQANLADGARTFGDAGVAAAIENYVNGNARLLGAITVGASAIDDVRWVASGVTSIFDRYVAIAAWNASAGKALSAVPADHWVMFQPIPTAIQAAA
jgi:hypothetical protein